MDQSKESGELQDHIFGTYIGLRRGLAAIGVAFPVLLLGLGFAIGLGWRSSLSAYYWAALPGATPPLRDLFVGSLFAIAACLHLYKGFTTPENVALNLAGIFGVGVAVFPTPAQECVGKCPLVTLHGACAIAMFAALAFVVLRCAGDTLSLLDPPTAARYRKRYTRIGLVMLASPLIAFVINSVIGRGKSYVFLAEVSGIWAFARYWWVKSGELELSSATKRALQGELKTSPQGKAEEAPPQRGSKRG